MDQKSDRALRYWDSISKNDSWKFFNWNYLCLQISIFSSVYTIILLEEEWYLYLLVHGGWAELHLV